MCRSHTKHVCLQDICSTHLLIHFYINKRNKYNKSNYTKQKPAINFPVASSCVVNPALESVIKSGSPGS